MLWILHWMQPVIIANRYADMAEEKAKGLEAKDKERFKLMAATLTKKYRRTEQRICMRQFSYLSLCGR